MLPDQADDPLGAFDDLRVLTLSINREAMFKSCMMTDQGNFMSKIETLCSVALVSAAIVQAQPPETPGPQAPMPAVLRNYQPVTPQRLKNPEDSNWLMIRRTYDGWGYSPLTQITPENAAREASRLGMPYPA